VASAEWAGKSEGRAAGLLRWTAALFLFLGTRGCRVENARSAVLWTQLRPGKIPTAFPLGDPHTAIFSFSLPRELHGSALPSSSPAASSSTTALRCNRGRPPTVVNLAHPSSRAQRRAKIPTRGVFLAAPLHWCFGFTVSIRTRSNDRTARLFTSAAFFCSCSFESKRVRGRSGRFFAGFVLVRSAPL